MAAYHVVWEFVVEQWLGVRRVLSNKRLAMCCVEGYLLYSQVHRGGCFILFLIRVGWVFV